MPHKMEEEKKANSVFWWLITGQYGPPIFVFPKRKNPSDFSQGQYRGCTVCMRQWI